MSTITIKPIKGETGKKGVYKDGELYAVYYFHRSVHKGRTNRHGKAEYVNSAKTEDLSCYSWDADIRKMFKAGVL